MIELKGYQKRKLQFLEDFPQETKLLKQLDDIIVNRVSTGISIEDIDKKIQITKKKLMCDTDAELQWWYVKMDGENLEDIEFYEKLYHEKYHDPTINYLANKKKRNQNK